MSDVEKRLRAKEAVTPAVGWNLVVIDDYEPAGEELTLASTHPTRAEAEAEMARRKKASPDAEFAVYGHQDAGGNQLEMPHVRKSEINPNAGRVSPEVVNEMVSPNFDARTGSGVNLQVGAPPRPIGGDHDTSGLKEWLKQAKPITGIVRRDLRVYELDQDNPDQVYPVVLDEGVMASAHDSPKDNLIAPGALEHAALSALVPRNRANPGWEPLSGRLPDENPEPAEKSAAKKKPKRRKKPGG